MEALIQMDLIRFRGILSWKDTIFFFQHYSLVMLLMYLNLALGHGQDMLLSSSTNWCQFYNSSVCPEGADSCQQLEQCQENNPGARTQCFVAWKNITGQPISIEFKGCMLSIKDCHNHSECVATKPGNRGAFFCCCEGDLCNRHFRWDVPPPVKTTPTPDVQPMDSTQETVLVIAITLAPILLLCGCILAAFFFYRRRKSANFNEIPSVDSGLPVPPSPPPVSRPVQLEELVARGRYVTVWRAQLRAEPVAVKIFPAHERASWQAERQVLELVHTRHENIVRLIGAEKHTDLSQLEYWIISEYCGHGSLCDYLKSHLVSWQQTLRLAEGIARGLSHLHEEQPLAGGLYKSPVAHRDFKSKNVLLRSDLTPCVADFGLALVFHQDRPVGNVHPQVGTRRYMAPEVLEGSICFHRDAFLRIDMYAVGLVLWEVVSRCSAAPGPVDDYRLPFEREVGPHPSLEDMQEMVANQRTRPGLQPHWRLHQGLEVLCETAEECWDGDAEARLSASCVLERVCSLAQLAALPPSPSVAAAAAACSGSSHTEPLLPPPPDPAAPA